MLFCTPTAPALEFDIHSYGPHGKHFPSVILECVSIGPLCSNGCPSIVESVIPGMRLPNCCLAMDICVKIFSLSLRE
jgi:hypothetical protein